MSFYANCVHPVGRKWLWINVASVWVTMKPKYAVCVCVCVCEGKRVEWEKEGDRGGEREGGREGKGGGGGVVWFCYESFFLHFRVYSTWTITHITNLTPSPTITTTKPHLPTIIGHRGSHIADCIYGIPSTWSCAGANTKEWECGTCFSCSISTFTLVVFQYFTFEYPANLYRAKFFVGATHARCYVLLQRMRIVAQFHFHIT